MIVGRHAFNPHRHLIVGIDGECLVLEHGHCHCHTCHLARSGYHAVGIINGLAFHRGDGNLRVEPSQAVLDHTLETVEHAQHAHQRSSRHHHPAYRDDGDDVDRVVSLLRLQVAERYFKWQRQWSYQLSVVSYQ